MLPAAGLAGALLGAVRAGERLPAGVHERLAVHRVGHLGAQDVADESGCRQEWAGRHLADGDGVEEFLLRQPVILIDQAALEVADQDVAAAEEGGADAEEEEGVV